MINEARHWIYAIMFLVISVILLGLIYKIARLAWHTNINTTNRYLHSADMELSDTVNMLPYR